MLTHSPDTQSYVCSEEQKLNANQNQYGDVKDNILLKEDISQPRNLWERSPGRRRKEQRGWQRWNPLPSGCKNKQQVAREAKSNNVNSDTAHNLICLKIDGDNAMNESHCTTSKDSGENTKYYTQRVIDPPII